MKIDVLALVEAAYAERSLPTWVSGLADAAQPLLDAGFGVNVHLFDVSPGTGAMLSHITTSSSPLTAARAEYTAQKVLERWPTKDGKAHVTETLAYPLAPWTGLLSERLRMTTPMYDVVDASGGSGTDAFGILAGDPSGRGVCISANMVAAKRPTAPERRLWMMVAVHLAAGYRILRARDESRVDAVLDGTGRLQHAEAEATTKDARESLQVAAKAIDRARGRLRRAAPEDALTLWRGLVDGKWSLVEQVDSDGKRFLFAKRNAPQPRPWHVLSERELQVVAYAAEGHAHKLIAYELGISESASTRHLQSAASKVGVRTRADLVREYRAAIAAQGRGS